ncbi:MAG: hypothetical protein RRY54_06430, partial [Angelakisella sp.]
MKFTEKLTLKINKRGVGRCAAALGGAVLFLLCQPYVMPFAERMIGHASLFSAALTMPQGTVDALRDRFAGD